MYVVGNTTTIRWPFAPTNVPLEITDFAVEIKAPSGGSFSGGNLTSFTAPTESTPGEATYDFLPTEQGFHVLTLVSGSQTSSQVYDDVTLVVTGYSVNTINLVLPRIPVATSYTPDFGADGTLVNIIAVAGDGAGRWCVAARFEVSPSNFDDRIFYSDDGLTWTKSYDVASGNQIVRGIYGGGKFVFFRQGGRPAYSVDGGETWSDGTGFIITSTASNVGQAAYYPSEDLFFLARGQDHYWSVGGTSWTLTSIGGGDWESAVGGNNLAILAGDRVEFFTTDINSRTSYSSEPGGIGLYEYATTDGNKFAFVTATGICVTSTGAHPVESWFSTDIDTLQAVRHDLIFYEPGSGNWFTCNNAGEWYVANEPENTNAFVPVTSGLLSTNREAVAEVSNAAGTLLANSDLTLTFFEPGNGGS